MAADKLRHAEGGPLIAVANMASKKIDGALAVLEECSAADDVGPVSAAPSAKPGSRPARTKRHGKRQPNQRHAKPRPNPPRPRPSGKKNPPPLRGKSARFPGWSTAADFWRPRRLIRQLSAEPMRNPTLSFVGMNRTRINGGRSGIRTHGGLASTAVFKTAALNRSAILPRKNKTCIQISGAKRQQPYCPDPAATSRRKRSFRLGDLARERLPVKWTHMTGDGSLRIKELKRRSGS